MKISKRLITILSIIIGSCVLYLTIQVVIKTDGPSWTINFDTYDVIIRSYTGLLGSLLSFLSILFVIYNIMSDREKVRLLVEEKNDDERKSYHNKLKMINSFLKTILKDIGTTHANLSSFTSIELSNPLAENTTKFVVNKSMSRISQMDTMDMFNIFQSNFKNDDFDTYFKDVYRLTDFYDELLPHLREKYVLHIEDKMSAFNEISKLQNALMDYNQSLINLYRIEYPTNVYINIVAKYNYDAHTYFEKCEREQIPQDLNIILDQYTEELKTALFAEQEKTKDITELESSIRNKTSNLMKLKWKIEKDTKDFAHHLNEQIELNFSESSSGLNEYKDLQKVIELKINTFHNV